MAFGLALVAGRLAATGEGAGTVLVRVEDWDVPAPPDHQEEAAAAADRFRRAPLRRREAVRTEVT
ncbi:hypothetical protein [Streptomyces sp. NPDC049590]|uniref:hypothetical protein n=1 Tax=Streptomyces sp. NPDC049590 TaxID=3154834 RepID=UPI00341E21CE